MSSSWQRRSSFIGGSKNSSNSVTTQRSTCFRQSPLAESPLDDLRARLASEGALSRVSGGLSAPAALACNSFGLAPESATCRGQAASRSVPMTTRRKLTSDTLPPNFNNNKHHHLLRQQQVGAPESEPRVELHDSSSSVSSCSAASSACNSPLTSRQSSECGNQAVSAVVKPLQQHQHHRHQSRSIQHGQQESLSSSSSRTIRRRTVRRSYHTRTAADHSNERSSSSPVSRRVLGSLGNQIAPCTPEEPEKPEEAEASNRGVLELRQEEKAHKCLDEQSEQKLELNQQQQASDIELISTCTMSANQTQSSASLFERRSGSRSSQVEQQQQQQLEQQQQLSRRSVETEEESIRRASFRNASCTSSSSSLQKTLGATTFGEASLSRHIDQQQQQQQQQHEQRSDTFSSNRLSSTNANFNSCLSQSSSSSFKSSASFFADRRFASTTGHAYRPGGSASALSNHHLSSIPSARKPFLMSNDEHASLIFVSPEVRSLVHEIGTDFAELENALINAQPVQAASNRLAAPPALPPSAALTSKVADREIQALLDETHSTITQMELAKQSEPLRLSPDSRAACCLGPSPSSDHLSQENSQRIRDLINRATSFTDTHTSAHKSAANQLSSLADSKANCIDLHAWQQEKAPSAVASLVDSRRQAVMEESIVRIDARMSDLCAKLEQTELRDSQKAIDLLKVMIQMIEKAWSVPVCGDDLGFKLCNSLRQAKGLDIVLASIRALETVEPATESPPIVVGESAEQVSTSADRSKQAVLAAEQLKSPRAKLKLNMPLAPSEDEPLMANERAANDGDDLMDSAPRLASKPADKEDCKQRAETDSALGLESASMDSQVAQSTSSLVSQPEQELAQPPNEPATQLASESELERMRKEELVLLSARLLSQCLTSDNRDYIVSTGRLDPVIKLACQFATMKSKQSKRLMKRSALMLRQSSSLKLVKQACNDPLETAASEAQLAKSDEMLTSMNGKQPSSTRLHTEQIAGEYELASDVHSAIGTEILQHLFKHSEETCSRMISLGALQAVLYGCRLTHKETLRHCASALANLALYGGSDSQQMMIEQKAHVWLFPLAFNEADEVRYYACLAIVVLAANQEIEADVLKSGTLDLVEPFVLSHEPQHFAESTTAHVHGQSASWLRKLMPLLESRREEARNLACFHFAMEAYIKREQGQTDLFRKIGAIEPLRKAASSPIAISSRYACQALRLIGEQEPAKLSQQVPLWTCEHVCEWIGQIGFERFRDSFRDSHVDGDLLLQLDEEALKFDLGMDNGILRRRFMRELSSLKRIADYSSVDRSGLGLLLAQTAAQALEGVHKQQPHKSSLQHEHQQALSHQHRAPTCPQQMKLLSTLNNMEIPRYGQAYQHTHPLSCASVAKINNPSAASTCTARDFVQYIYPILQLGVTRDNIHLVDCDQLLAECNISNALHRTKLAYSIRELQERTMQEVAACEEEQRQRALSGDLGEQNALLKTLDVFVSYRRSTGSQLASLLKVHLQLRGFSVFIDVERLEAGKFDNNLLESVKSAKNFILVLSPQALDRCIGDHDCKDWVHKEIVAALASNCNIIPIMDNFHWPEPEQLPEDMRSISYFNGVRWIHDYQDACVDKVERFIRGEFSNGSIISSVGSVCSQQAAQISQLSSNHRSAPLGQQQQQQQQLDLGQQRQANSAMVHIPSTPLSVQTPSCGGQLAAAAQPQAQYHADQKTFSITPNTGAHPSDLANTPKSSSQHPLAQAGQKFSGSLSNGPSSYRLR